MPEVGLALGYEKGEHIAWYREWLYWYDQSGNRYLTAAERENQAGSLAAQERLAKEEAEQRATRLVERVRLLVIKPDEM